jgi:uncharacterized protein (TIGR02301 family)
MAMKRVTIALACAVALFAASGQLCNAETTTTKPAAAPKAAAEPTPPPAVERPAPYESQLLRLAEMMGALAYLRNLCGSGDGAKFRAKIAALLGAEGINDSRRDLIAGAYNHGFRGYAMTYRACTPAATEVISSFLTESARLAAELASRYGG